jgi:dihydrofolate reductase
VSSVAAMPDSGSNGKDIATRTGANMRELIITENITIDGVIDAAGGWFAPGGDNEIDQSDVLDALREQREAADALLVGRVTFEQMRGYWPLQAGDTTGIAYYLDNVAKYVVSTTLTEPNWEHTTVLKGSLVERVQALKSSPGSDIVTTGSMTLTADLIAAGLVDEYRLFVYPVVIGRGHRLFTDTTDVPGLHLEEVRAFGSGIVLLRYRTTPRGI